MADVAFLCPRCQRHMDRGTDAPTFVEWSCEPCDLVLRQMKLRFPNPRRPIVVRPLSSPRFDPFAYPLPVLRPHIFDSSLF